MDASAAALNTTPAAPPPAANDAAVVGTGAADFLALLTAAPAAKAAKTKGVTGKTGVTPIARSAGEANETAEASGGRTPSGKSDLVGAVQRTGGPARVALTAAAAGTGGALADSAATSTSSGALPAALMAALSAAAQGGASGLETPAVGAAQPVDETARRDKAKPVRTATARADGGDRAAKGDAAPASPAARSEPAPTDKIAKPQDASPPAAAKSGEPAPAAPAFLQPAAADPAAPGLAGGAGTGAEMRDVRIPLAREVAAQTAVAAPVLALRVHTKDGAMRAIEIRLDPAELGQVDVKLETGSDGKLKAVLSAENAESFELLKRESGALESALREAGVELGEDAITFTLNEQGSGAAGGEREAAYGAAAARRDGDAAQEIAALPVVAAGWRTGVIDISV